MKYYLDTEFIEGPQKGITGKSKPTIDLISIGIVSEDDKTYYSISNEFNIKEAWNRYDTAELTSFEKYHGFSGKKIYWIRDNVLKPIFEELCTKEYGYSYVIVKKGTEEIKTPVKAFTLNRLKMLVKKYGKSNIQIANEVVEFIYEKSGNMFGLTPLQEAQKYEPVSPSLFPTFYGYYSDYDWVVFCWLFGRMIDLPKGFPMYCNDLKQQMDDIIKKSWDDVSSSTFGHTGLTNIKSLPGYPVQTNEHNALEDAKWNKQLHKFLEKL